MPACSWKTAKGFSSPERSVCFAFMTRAFNYSSESLFLFASYLSYADSKVWTDAVKRDLGGLYSFELNTHGHTTKSNPFTDTRLPYPSPDSKGTVKSYWSIRFPEDTNPDLAYALIKLIFKNITYGHRKVAYGWSGTPDEMIKAIKDGATIFEAMLMNSAIGGNGYGYPMRLPSNNRNKKLVDAFLQGQMYFDRFKKNTVTMGDVRGVQSWSIHGTSHSPISPISYAAHSVFNKASMPATLENFRKLLGE